MPAKFETKITKARFVVSPYTAQEMIGFGQSIISSNFARWDHGMDANDGTAPPLKPRYAAFKSRRYGRAVRNMNLTGRLRRSIKVLTANQNKAVMGTVEGIHTRSVKRRSLMFSDVLRLNNRRWRMWGISPRDKSELSRSMRPVVEAQQAA
jgi:hypothetical protein